MCGITGLYSFDPRPDRVQLHGVARDMSDALRMRGPDSDGLWQDPDALLVLGHRRLSIIDLSPAGHQPMESASGRYMLTYNGEIYNFKEIKAALKLQEFRGGSDTEILLAAIEEWGLAKTLDQINGMFAFALWDRKLRSLTLARDRFGKKPLYVGWAGSSFVFASELKAICAHPDFRRDVDRGALTSYMRFGYVPAPMCIYDQMWQVQPGMMMRLDFAMMHAGQDLQDMMSPYWSAKDALETARDNLIEVDDLGVIKEFEGILSDCVKDRMMSDVPLGAFLSGGIDSSTIVALMQKNADRPIKTYSIGFNEAGYNEAEHANEVATHLGTDHHEMMFGAKEALDVVPSLAQIFDEPFADASALPTYMVSKFASESVTVALSGDGGDEMLGGYNRHISAPKAWRIIQSIPPRLRNAAAAIICALPPHMWDKMRANRPQFGAHMHKFARSFDKACEGDMYLGLVSMFDKPKSIVMDGREDMIPLVDPDFQINGLSFAEDMMYWDALSYLNGDILTKVDRATMATSLEARAPLLDRRIYDYVWRLPIEMKIRDKQGKWLLRQVLENHVPRAMFDRPKQGFSVPVAQWLRGDLKDWAEDLLDEGKMRTQGLLDYKYVREMWDAHQKGQGAHANQLWTILMFQAWHKEWVEGAS